MPRADGQGHEAAMAASSSVADRRGALTLPGRPSPGRRPGVPAGRPVGPAGVGECSRRRSRPAHARLGHPPGAAVGLEHVVDVRDQRSSRRPARLVPSRVPSTTSAMAVQRIRPSRKACHRHLVGGVEPGRGRSPGPAGLVGQVEAGETSRSGGSKSSGDSVGPVDAPERPCRAGRGRPGRTRSAGACRAARAGRWWRRR